MCYNQITERPKALGDLSHHPQTGASFFYTIMCYYLFMADTFYIDKNSKRKFKKQLSKLQRKFVGAAGMTLNDFAFGARKEYVDVIHSRMQVRNTGFIKRQLWAEQAKFSQGINHMQSKAGSRDKNNFSGWREQIEGSRMKRDKAITLAARGGSSGRRVKPSVRMRKGKNWKQPRHYKGRGMRGKADAMLQQLGREGYRQPFVIYGHRTLPSGLWMFGGGPRDRRRLVALQLFGERAKVRRLMWMPIANKLYFNSNPPGRTWERHAKKQFSKLKQ